MSDYEKKPAASRTWIDLTDMLVWTGHVTGIQRVVIEYAARFSKENARFFAYDQQDDRFFEIDADILNTANRLAVETVTQGATMTRRQKVRRFIGKPYYALPERHKQVLQPTVAYANYLARTVISLLTPNEPGSRKKPSRYAHQPTAHFTANDTLVLLGAGWNEKGLFEAICRVKAATGCRVSQHVNDILPIYQPQLFSDELVEVFTPYISSVIRNADVITVISKATKRDIAIYCRENGVKPPEIKVVRLGDDPKIAAATRPEDISEDEKFILCLGTFEIRKNYLLIYQALKLAQLEGRNLPKIIIAGRPGWLTHDLVHVIERDPYVRDHMHWIRNASDEELSWLFEHCMFTVFPSLSEGWGLPMVESLQHGKMCIASGVSSMLEIGEDFVDYFLPYDARECLEKMQFYLAEDRYLSFNKRISKEYKPFTWDESFSQLKRAVE